MSVPSNQKTVLIHGRSFAACLTVCDVQDSPRGPEYRLFGFRDGCTWPPPYMEPIVIETVSVYSYWPPEGDLTSVPVQEGSYRVCRRSKTVPAGYRAVLEGTTLPKERKPEPVFDEEAGKCQQAIVDALAAEPELTLYALKRKVHAERFGLELWLKCIQALTEAGEIRQETRLSISKREQLWIIRCDEPAPGTESPAPASAP